MSDLISYILEFLLQDKAYVKYVGYTKDASEWKNYKVVIVPSEFFDYHKAGTPLMPHTPLQTFEGMPILFGTPSVLRTKDLTVIKADLVASALFVGVCMRWRGGCGKQFEIKRVVLP